ncbi:MAG: site-specific DNA-methyltransferase [candidate division Zixibacteria bacterium]|nr:site-specific DNA-methyltransferase [candidate division Zixibacteria bacterium]
MTTVQYIIGDARNLEKNFTNAATGKCQMIITSPPYYDIKNYGGGKRQIGQHQSYEEFLVELADIFQQCYYVSRPNATLWIVADTIRKDGRLINLPVDIERCMTQKYRAHTWILRDIIIWDKHKNIPWHSKGHLKNRFEYILFFSKSSHYKYYIDRIREITDYRKWWLSYPERYNSMGTPPTNIWEFNPPIRGWGNGYQDHMCPFPFALVERILTLASDVGDLVLDPFAGSGTVLALAKVMKRHAIGFDVNRKYKDKFKNEVIFGAQKYWATRVKSLDKARESINDFTRKNAKLRKIKAACAMAKHISQLITDKHCVLALSEGRTKSYVKLMIVSAKSIKAKGVLNSIAATVNSISKEFKVSIAYSICNKQDFQRIYEGPAVLYGYCSDRIYSFEDVVPANQVLNGHPTSSTVLSNIRLELAKPISNQPDNIENQ